MERLARAKMRDETMRRVDLAKAVFLRGRNPAMSLVNDLPIVRYGEHYVR